MIPVYVGRFSKGLRDDIKAFNIDNDAFPFLFNAYVWRGQVKRKRGTETLGRLTLQVVSNFLGNITAATQATSCVLTVSNNFTNGDSVYIAGVQGMTNLNGNTYTITAASSSSITINVNSTGFPAYTGGGIAVDITKTAPFLSGSLTITASGGNGIANLISYVGASSAASIVRSSVNIIYLGNVYIDNGQGVLLVNGISSGTINYATGAIVLTGVGAGTAYVSFSYYPGLPVMGNRDFDYSAGQDNYPLLVAFDTVKAYQCDQKADNASFYNVSYYKGTNNPVSWSGQDYEQFWTTNYPRSSTNQSGAFWATNNVPGLHYADGTYGSGSGTTAVTVNLKVAMANLTTLKNGDVLFFDNWTPANTINGKTGTITDASGAASGNYVVTFSSSVTASGTGTVQLLTSSIAGQDGIRWYDGDMTAQTGLPTSTSTGWVNFAPPLAATTVSILGLPARHYYLVGALAIVPFKDRLLFFSPYVQEAGGLPINLKDAVIYSQNGTPFYANAPNNQTSNFNAYFVNTNGKNGGFISSGIAQPIQTVSNNEDVLLVGFGGNGRKTRLAFTGNNLFPFLFYNINAELPSTSTFSSISLDHGAIDIGSFGICMTTQQSAERIDLDIPDAVFQIQKENNGAQRVNAVRDYVNEWIYFCYPVDDNGISTQIWKFPTQTFLFNYRDNTWAIFYENFTCHGSYRPNNVTTWANLPYLTWDEWTDPWNSGSSTTYEVRCIAGNPQGYILVKGMGTGEGVSGSISDVTNDGFGNTQITSYNHCLQSANPNTADTDYIYIQGCLFADPVVVPMNDKCYRVVRVIDENNFVINRSYETNTYLGLGQLKKLSQPFILTKQFNFFWDKGYKCRLGPQRYLLDYTTDGKITLNIYLSQNNNDPWNNPSFAGTPNSLVYSQTLFTCPETTLLSGITPPNVNLQMQVSNCNQIWHRVNTSLIGDSVQIGFTLNEAQMTDINQATNEIVLQGIHLQVAPSAVLA